MEHLNFVHRLFARDMALSLALLEVSAVVSVAEAATRIAVIPIADNTPPGLQAAQVTAGKIESILNDRGHLTVVDSGSVASSVRKLKSQAGAQEVDWRDVASDLNLDLVALLSIVDAHVEYLGEQPDHLAVGEFTDKPGTVHLYEGKVVIRLSIVEVDSENTLLDEEARGDKADRYRQSHDAAKYAVVVNAVRDLAAIFDDSVKTRGAATLTEEYSPLAISALEKAADRLSKPLEKAFPLRGVIILVEGRDLTVDIGADSGLKTGMRFHIARPGKVVTHPTTGQQISTGEEFIGKAKVSRVSASTAVLKADRKASATVEVGFFIVEDT